MNILPQELLPVFGKHKKCMVHGKEVPQNQANKGKTSIETKPNKTKTLSSAWLHVRPRPNTHRDGQPPLHEYTRWCITPKDPASRSIQIRPAGHYALGNKHPQGSNRHIAHPFTLRAAQQHIALPLLCWQSLRILAGPWGKRPYTPCLVTSSTTLPVYSMLYRASSSMRISVKRKPPPAYQQEPHIPSPIETKRDRSRRQLP